MIKIKKTNSHNRTVYDISLDGTVVNALGMNVASNTDGFNFKLPDESLYRYTKENPYIGKGSNREVVLGKEYTGFEADVAEFNDLYMNKVYSENGVQKMGLGIDEVVSATINFSRKNYADYFPDNPYPEDVKLVGNTIKSKKMPEYIAKFLEKGIRMLLRGEGQNFLNEYYSYVDKIYNYRIPLRDIATKGKIKKSIEQYKKDIQEITKAGRPKSRQAWYELAIKYDMKVDNGDTIYYVNTGKSKSHSDVKKVTHYYDFDSSDLFGGKKEITKDIEREYKKYKKEIEQTGVKAKKKDIWLKETYPTHFIEEEILFNCIPVPREIIEAEGDVYCNDENGIEYNSAKYVETFNNRIKPLLVCFSKEIRDEIIITNPKDRKYFTESQAKLVSGEPNKPTDQDTYEQLMTMEDKEFKFWDKYGLIPPFIEECRMGKWEELLEDYHNRLKEEMESGILAEKEYIINAIEEMSKDDVKAFFEEGTIPNSILKICDLDPITMEFMSIKYPDKSIGNLSMISDVCNDKLLVS